MLGVAWSRGHVSWGWAHRGEKQSLRSFREPGPARPGVLCVPAVLVWPGTAPDCCSSGVKR